MPGIQATDGFSVVVRIIHAADRFNPLVKTQDENLTWQSGTPLDLWSQTEIVDADTGEDELPSCSAVEALSRQEPFINQTLAASVDGAQPQ